MNNRGMSLISVLAAVAVVGVLAAGVMTLSQNMMQVVQTSDLASDIQDDLYIARVNLSKEYNCTANFKDLKLNTKLSSSDMKIRLTKSPTNLTLSSSYILPSQDPKNTSAKMKISKMELKPYPPSSNIALLAISFQSKNSNILGGETRVREIPLRVTLSGGKIVTCSAGDSVINPPPEDDEAVTKQGTACNSSPSISYTYGGGGGVSGANTGSVTTISKTDIRSALDTICDSQTYPLTSGLEIGRSQINKVCTGGRPSKPCYALTTLRTAEGTSSSSDKDIILKKRTGYQTAADCKKQKLFSEGDVAGRAFCVNGSWAKFPAEVAQSNGGKSDGGDH